MQSNLLMVAIVVALLIATIAIATMLIAGRRDARARQSAEARLSQLGDAAAALAAAQQEIGGRLSQMSEQNAAERAALTRSLQERLDGVSKRMGDSLSQSSSKTANSLGELRKHLEVIDHAQKNIAELTGQVIGLQDILDNKQARGAFGEVQLRDLVGAILPPSAYAFQTALGNGRRVDCLVRLPQPPGPICIDSKFTLESYHALRAAKDEAAVKRAQRDFRAAIQKHINDIRDRYIVAGETADSALMFVPSEAVYAELHANFADVVELSYRARVWIVSPTTMMATLNTVRAVLKDARMREAAGVIQTQVQLLLDDVRRLDDRVDGLKRHHAQTEKDLKDIGISTTKIINRAGKIEDLQLDDADQADPLDAPDDEPLAVPPPPKALTGG